MAKMNKRCVLLCLLVLLLLTFALSNNATATPRSRSRNNKSSFLTNTSVMKSSARRNVRGSEDDESGEEESENAKGNSAKQMFVYKAFIEMYTTNVTQVAQEISQDISQYEGAFVSKAHVGRGSFGRSSAVMTVRVPKDNYHDFLATWTNPNSKKFTLSEVRESATEESANYVDTKTTILNLEAAHKQMTMIMKSAKEVKDVLTVQTALNQISQKLDGEKAKMKHLQTSIALATVDFRINFLSVEPEEPPRANRLHTAIVKPLEDAQHFYINFMLGTVSFLVYLVVFYIPLGFALSPLLLFLYLKMREINYQRFELLHAAKKCWQQCRANNDRKKHESDKASV